MIGGIVQGIGQIAGSLINANSQAKQMKMQLEENQKDRDWQEAMWNKSNEYNDPSQQLQRYKDAGLNPNLVFGQGASSLAAQFGAPSSHNVGTSPQYGDAFKSLANAIPAMVELSNLKKQGENLDADKDLKNAQAEEIRSRIPGNKANAQGKTLDNMFNMDTYEARKLSIDLDNQLKTIGVSLKEEEKSNLIEFREQIMALTKVYKEQADNYHADTDYKRALTWKTDVERDQMEKSFNERLASIRADIRQKIASAYLSTSMADQGWQKLPYEIKILDRTYSNMIQEGNINWHTIRKMEYDYITRPDASKTKGANNAVQVARETSAMSEEARARYVLNWRQNAFNRATEQVLNLVPLKISAGTSSNYNYSNN